MRNLIIFSWLISCFPTVLLGAGTFTEEHTLCRNSMESAQKSAYLRAVGSVKHCHRPSIASPTSDWDCEELRESPRQCRRENKKYIKCSREYECRYMNTELTKEVIENRIKSGETGAFFERKISSDSSEGPEE